MKEFDKEIWRKDDLKIEPERNEIECVCGNCSSNEITLPPTPFPSNCSVNVVNCEKCKDSFQYKNYDIKINCER